LILIVETRSFCQLRHFIIHILSVFVEIVMKWLMYEVAYCHLLVAREWTDTTSEHSELMTIYARKHLNVKLLKVTSCGWHHIGPLQSSAGFCLPLITDVVKW